LQAVWPSRAKRSSQKPDSGARDKERKETHLQLRLDMFQQSFGTIFNKIKYSLKTLASTIIGIWDL
jgi:hypothetical protein